MMIYRRHTERTAKWLVALVFFIAVMTFTVDEVFGLPAPARPSSNNSTSGSPSHGGASTYDSNAPSSYNDCGTDSDPAPNAVPEPTTLILFGLGLAAAGTVRRKIKQ